MNKQREAMKLALEALEESLGYVQEEAENAQRLYGQYPTRQARIQGLKDDARKHMDAITALREALASEAIEQPSGVATIAQQINQETRTKNGLKYSPNYVAGYNDGLKAALAENPAQPQQEPVAWYDEEYDSAYTAAELDGGNVDGLQPLYTSLPTLSLAQRQRSVKPLNWEPIQEFWRNNSSIDWDELEAAVEAAHGIYAPTELKEKNT